MEKNKLQKNKKIYIILIIIAIAIILIDQIFKMIVQASDEIVIIPNVLNFKVQESLNVGDTNSTITFIITNLVVFGIMLKIITSENSFIKEKIKIFLTLALAGGISNLLDRIIRGYAVEFIDFTPSVNIPIFNFADILIIIGWLAFVWDFAAFTVKELQSKRKDKKE